MKKELIGPHNLDKFLGPDDTVFRLGPDKILTPGARDLLRNRGIRIKYTNDACEVPAEQEKAGNASDDVVRVLTGLAMTIVVLLDKDYGIKDPAALEEITLAVLPRLADQ